MSAYHADMASDPPNTNRLAGETSPYLLQHAHNPVDWYPWGDEALTKASETDRPIFLSVGYAACHWCHVMERESFEDEQTAADLNRNFVAIKVDREERPDIDGIYMSAVQAMTGQGGWPMNVFLTPDGRPFFGGTYFPDEARHGIPSFRQVLARITEVWNDDRDGIETAADRVAEGVRDSQNVPSRLLEAIKDQPSVSLDDQMAAAVASLKEGFDPINGGWGTAPKFPQSMSIELLLAEHIRTNDPEPRLLAAKTLDAMAAGGINDQLGGGFARYATDAAWLVPHFEKMLYDNAQLARVYAHAALVIGDDRYAYVARETLDFVAHELRVPADGAFASSLDADTDGTEGATYVWTAQEVREVLGDDAALFEQAFGVTERGNWEGHTILSRVRDDTSLAVEHERPRDEIAETIANARVKLLRVRDERPQPARDDKVLTSWNGLMIGAFAEGGVILSEPTFIKIAAEAADFVLRELRTAEGRLLRSWKDGRAQHDGTLEDHSHLADGLMALYEATFEERYFIAARELMDLVIEHFGAEDGGFYDTADDAEALMARPREIQDNALPSGGAMATHVLIRLAALTGEGRYRTAAENALRPVTAVASEHPSAFAQWLRALQLAESTVVEVAIVGKSGSDDTSVLLKTARDGYHPGRVIALADDATGTKVPLLHDRTALEDRATAYVCKDFACQRPTADPTELARQLDEAAAS